MRSLENKIKYSFIVISLQLKKNSVPLSRMESERFLLNIFLKILGYGFVDFDSPAAAQKAVSALKATGVQAQMAKVR